MTEKHEPTSKIADGAPDKPGRQSDPTQRPDTSPSRSRVGALWAGIIVSAVVLILLLTFIVQNGDSVQINFLVWAVTLPLGVALLAAAIGGILVVAVPGASRMMQLRRAARRPTA
jgi:uncharacterized integral membrane protein